MVLGAAADLGSAFVFDLGAIFSFCVTVRSVQLLEGGRIDR